MSRDKVNAVSVLLAELTPTERDEIRARLCMLGTGRKTTHVEPVEQVYKELSKLIKGFLPFKQLRLQEGTYYRFERGCLRLQKYIDETCGEKLGRGRPQVISRLLQCVLADLKYSEIGLGPVTIGDRMLRISDVVESAFPGYTAAGLLGPALMNTLAEGTE